MPAPVPLTDTRAVTSALAVVQMEPQMGPLYEAALDEVAIRPGTRLLDVGCGAGRLLELAARRGAEVSGIDASGPYVDIARDRVPEADLAVGDLGSLPFEDDSFDAITGIDAFPFAADPARALREVARVGRTGAPVVIAAWGRPDQCEAAAYLNDVGALLPTSTRRPFALAEEGALEAFAEAGGLQPGRRREVLCVWTFRDEGHAVRTLSSTDVAVAAAEIAGVESVDDAIRQALEPYAMSDGGFRLENTFTYLVAQV